MIVERFGLRLVGVVIECKVVVLDAQKQKKCFDCLILIPSDALLQHRPPGTWT
jgi:hypothetical protein